jgi:endonuclease/exonuclease/phosphatase family metal-dependent hydrolase
MTPIRLLTANLWNGRADAGALADVIAEHAPDIVLSQELAPEHARVIERLLPHGIMLPARDCRGMGIALRNPARVARLPLAHRDALCARLEPESWAGLGTAIEVINVHMSAPTGLARFAKRRSQVHALREHLTRAPMPRVLAGDLNSPPLMPAYRALRRHLRDAALTHAPWPSATWSPRPHWPRLLRIDHVLSHELQVTSLEVIRIAGGDHSALLATFAQL